MSKWRAVALSDSQMLVLELALLNMFIGTVCTLNKSAEDTKLCGQHAGGKRCHPERVVVLCEPHEAQQGQGQGATPGSGQFQAQKID